MEWCAFGLLVLVYLPSAFCSLFGIDECLSSFPLDAESNILVLNCDHTNVKVQFDIHSDFPFAVIDLVYQNSNEQVKVSILEGLYVSEHQVTEIKVDPPLNSSIHEWTLLFCYENDNFDAFQLTSFTCKIENDDSYDDIDDDLWFSTTSKELLQTISLSQTTTTTPLPISPSATTVTPNLSPGQWNASTSPVIMDHLMSSVMSTYHIDNSTTVQSINYRSSIAVMVSSIIAETKTIINATTVATTVEQTNTSSILTSQTDVVKQTSSSATPDIITTLVITVCLCVTIIVTSFSLVLCIVRFTKQSKEAAAALHNEQLHGPMKKDMHSSFSSLSPSIVTTISPLAWEIVINKDDDNYDTLRHDPCINVYETDINGIIAMSDDVNGGDLDSNNNNTMLDAADSVKMSYFGSSNDSDTSNNTVNLALLESDRFSETYSICESDTISGDAIAVDEQKSPHCILELVNTLDASDKIEMKSLCTDGDGDSELSNIELKSLGSSSEYDDQNSSGRSQYYTFETAKQSNRMTNRQTTDDSLSNPNNVYIVLNSSEQLRSHSNGISDVADQNYTLHYIRTGLNK